MKKCSDITSKTPDWSFLESRVTKCFKRTPHYTTLLGFYQILLLQFCMTNMKKILYCIFIFYISRYFGTIRKKGN